MRDFAHQCLLRYFLGVLTITYSQDATTDIDAKYAKRRGSVQGCDNRLDVCLHDTAGCQTVLNHWFDNWLYTGYNRLSIRFDNQFDMGVKFGMEEGTPNFTPIGATCCPVGRKG